MYKKLVKIGATGSKGRFLNQITGCFFMIEILIPLGAFLGIFIGILIAKSTREEIRNNRSYILVLSKIIIGILIFIILITGKSLSLLFIGVLLGFLSAYLLSEFLFLGLELGIILLQKEVVLVASSLVFMYSLLYGSLLRITKLNFTRILVLFIMFFLPFSVFLFETIIMKD